MHPHLSNCCTAAPLGEITDNLGTCSQCKEHAEFIPELLDPQEWQILFGKYQGDRLCNVPVGYLQWLIEQDFIDANLGLVCGNIYDTNRRELAWWLDTHLDDILEGIHPDPAHAE